MHLRAYRWTFFLYARGALASPAFFEPCHVMCADAEGRFPGLALLWWRGGASCPED